MVRNLKEDRDDRTRTHPKKPPCLHDLFREQARRTPDIPALADGSGETGLLYRELDRLTDGLASRLRRLGVGRDVPVGIYMERSTEYVVAMLAALKAGGAFLPLELAYPPAMLEKVVRDSAVDVVLTKSPYLKDLPGETSRAAGTLTLDEGWADGLSAATEDELAEAPDVSPDDLAFIAYSSGTTGEPKGIANPHRAATGSYAWRFGIDAPEPGDRVGCNVFFIWEALRPLIRGATTLVIPDDAVYDPEALVRFLGESRITETLFTPSLLETVLNHSEATLASDLPDLKKLWLNGEVVTKRLVGRAAKALPKTRLLTVYSISEAHEVAAGDLRKLSRNSEATHCPVGAPFDAGEVHVLDEELHPVPPGEPGELFVGGDWLAREYVNLPEKTAERFIPDPRRNSGRRLYRTGDRARLLGDGTLEVLGRCDFMVKVRGYSIELGAVEAAVEDLLPVRSSCVVAEGEEGTDKRLVAYLVPSGEGGMPEIDRKTGRSVPAREALKAALPHYALPSAYVELDALPLQEATGKVDRAKLPPPPPRAAPANREPERLPEGEGPEEEEAALSGIFESVLSLEPGDVGREDDFFEIGGHSLAAAELLTKIETAFGVRLPVSEVLASPTPAGLRERISAFRAGGSVRENAPDPRADAVLGRDISPASPGPPWGPPLREAREVFLTGATGFLGAFLLAGLLRGTSARVGCLVRRRAGEAPLAPVRENLRRYGLWRADFARRIVPVPGDLARPRLGLDRDAFEDLSERTDLVLHAGAGVNLVYPYSALRAVNVEGTREVLRLCCSGRPKPLHHVSTDGVFPPGSGVCREDADLEPLLSDLEDGYGQTKWAAEMLVREAARRGLPVSVYRPGNLSGSSESGASNPKDLLTNLLSASLKLGLAPEPDGGETWRFEATPVDSVARSILALADRPADSSPETFGLAAPEPGTAQEVFDDLEAAGYPLRRVPFEEWLEALASPEAPDSGLELERAVIGSGEALRLALATGNVSDDRNTRRALASPRPGGLRASPERTPLDRRLLALYARRLLGGGIETETEAKGE
ncbi:Thioester-redct: thioester reductase domain [Rubrobacter radiotolerans]|uniref:Thioester reductase domain-containing protein n=1 Tax=Rubrobacter radiotolerans TaxID=42256 RepID=A0A023X1F1_RUBRA|nr:non-ribosomal peptide synthetase [Rubrobacter radiotolerans]AHY45894.1 Thioester-redct: thioester reductase domain [Rubrobacter radiotolerans]MDX5893308.1 thioester reductase domain-containing protein [Rubrobacter radiotolerans]